MLTEPEGFRKYGWKRWARWVCLDFQAIEVRVNRHDAEIYELSADIKGLLDALGLERARCPAARFVKKCKT